MREFFCNSRLALGILSLAYFSLSSVASAGIIAIGGTARPGFDHANFELRTLEIPVTTYRRLNARLSYRSTQMVELVIGQQHFMIKRKGSCLVDANETLLIIPLDER